jgi:hypothetical protein
MVNLAVNSSVARGIGGGLAGVGKVGNKGRVEQVECGVACGIMGCSAVGRVVTCGIVLVDLASTL